MFGVIPNLNVKASEPKMPTLLVCFSVNSATECPWSEPENFNSIALNVHW